MAKYFRGRKSFEIRAFLEAHGFILQATHGDDDVYRRPGYQYTVKIPNRNNEDIPIGTMDYVKRCIRNCGIAPKDILRWWKENGYGD